MSESSPQNFKNHGRFDPIFHFFLAPLAIANVIVAIIHLVHHRSFPAGWLVVLSVGAFMALFKLRSYPIKVQDRVIRLEERLRLQVLGPADWHSQIYLLSEDQLIALRFASDGEVVDLARQALAENLTRKQIKERIKNWRADNWRV